MNEQVTRILFDLLRFEICDTPLPEASRDALTVEVLPALYTLSKHHDLAHLVADALDRNQLLPAEGEVGRKLQKQRMLAIYRYQQLQYELTRACRALGEAKIPHLPLKGSVLREHYPAPWMRTSCDIDILVHPEDLDAAMQALCEKLSYQSGSRASHDVTMVAQNGVHVELHFDLIEESRYPQMVKQLSRVWEYAEPIAEGSFRYVMKDEMFYYYHVAHMAKHFENGGCGIRTFLDQWVLDHCVPHDQNARIALLEEGGIDRFCTVAGKMADVWLSGKTPEGAYASLEAFVLSGGSYGTLENGVAVRRSKKKKGRLHYIFTRLFLPYDLLKYQFPVLERHRWLIPICQVRRWLRVVRSGRVGRTVREINRNSAISEDEIRSVSDLRQFLGL